MTFSSEGVCLFFAINKYTFYIIKMYDLILKKNIDSTVLTITICKNISLTIFYIPNMK